jgi:hypothetical protein
MEDNRPQYDEEDEPILMAVTYDETSEQFEERIISLVNSQMGGSSGRTR